MKTRLKRSMAVLLSLVLVLSTFFALDFANAAATTKAGDNATYTFNKTTGVLTISGSGPMYNFRMTNLLTAKRAPWQDEKENIKKVVIDEGITTVGEYSFFNCENLTEVSLPSTITTICGSGTQSASYGAFQACPSLTTINFPEGLTVIQNCAFKGCTKLTGIKFPSTLTEIQFSAFYQCENIRSVVFPDSLTTLGMNAFDSCTNLTDVTFGAGMTKTCTSILADVINPGVFREAGVKRVDFGPSITEISPYTFYGCKFTSVEIPEQITSIGTRAFGDTYYLHNATVYNPNLEYKGIIGEDPFNAGDRQVVLTMYGHSGSTTQAYAEVKNYNFVSIDDCDHETTFDRIVIPATCTEKGSKDVVCENCLQVVKTLDIDALGHEYEVTDSIDEVEKNGHITYEQTCSRCGDIAIVIEHQQLPSDGEDGEESGIGSVIGGVGSTLNPHYIWVDGYYTYTNSATCTRPGIEVYTCTYEGCGTVERNATRAGNHKVDKWTTTKKATCTEDGEQTGKCTVCQADVTETIKATGHTITDEDLVSTEDKTETDGHIYKNYKCQVCGAIDQKIEHVEWIEGVYTPNVITPARCVVNGLERDTCDICGATQNVVLQANGQHDWYVTNTTDPTCTAVGKIFYACNNCNLTKSDNIEALGHDFVIDEKSCKEPTCKSAGYTTYKCSRCSASMQEAIPAKGHVPLEETYVVSTKVTCESDGYATATCSVCGENYSETIKALGHDFVDISKPVLTHPGHNKVTPTCSRCNATQNAETIHSEWIEGYYTTEVTVEPGCLVQGRTRYTCTYCDTTKTEVTSPALGHHYIATGTITANSNISYRCEFCNAITTQNPHVVMSMWNMDYLGMDATNRTSVDNSCLADANGDGYVNAKDYALLRNLCKVAKVPDAPVDPEEPGTAPTREQFIAYHFDVIQNGITYVDEDNNEITIEGIQSYTKEEAQNLGYLYRDAPYPITAWPELLDSDQVPSATDPSVIEDSTLRYYYCIATSNETTTVYRIVKSSQTEVTAMQLRIAEPYYQAYLIANGLTRDIDTNQKLN